MRLNFTRRFEKQRAKLPKSVKKKLNERVLLFCEQPFNTQLDNHVVHGEYAGCRSINVTGDYRAIYYHVANDAVRFIALGTHHELFGS